MSTVPPHRYAGARTLILLHEEELRRFLDVWREAREQEVALPATKNPSYASLDHLLHHVLRYARIYMVWMTEKLGLEDPGIELPPEVEELPQKMDDYVDHVLARWRTPLVDVAAERFDEAYPSTWGVTYCIDGMLEHAVMHPWRHRFQLEGLLRG